MEMSEAIQEAYAYADPDITIWETFEFEHEMWEESIKLVASSRQLVTADGTYQPVTMSATMPETESSVRGQMQIEIEFLPIAYRKMLWAASHEDESVYVYYRQYIEEGESAEAELELPVALTISNFEFADNKTVVTALYPDLVNILLCRRVMTATRLPGGRI